MMQTAPQHLTLQQLLTDRLFRIPQYQRSYSWGERQRKDLFEDIKQSFGAGTSADHFMATVIALVRDKVNIPGSLGEHRNVDIVDGQQRITTLILLLKAIAKSLGQSDTVEASLRSNLEKMLVKADDATLLLLQTNHDSSHHFATYVRTGKYVDVNQAKTLADRQLLNAMKECEDFVREWKTEGHPLENLVTHIHNRLTFIYHEINDEGLVYTVFEVLNSRGLPVPWFDRLKSKLMALVFESTETGNRDQLINEVHQLWTDIYGIIGLRRGMSAESLRFAATLHAKGEPYRPLSEEASVDLLHNLAMGGPHNVIKITEWLKSVTEAVNSVRGNPRLSAVTDIQQARLVATSIHLLEGLGPKEKERILRRWENVTFRIYGMYAKDARTSVGDYTKLAWQIANRDFSTSKILDELASIGKKYPIEKAVEELKQTNCYEKLTGDELKYFFHRYEEHLSRESGQKFENQHWAHIWARDAAESIEHILPQSSGEDHIHWLGNLLLLPPGLNSKLGASQPQNKAEPYKETGMKIAVDAAEKVSNGWSREEIKRREKELLEWAAKEWAD